jgi:hypothetical protein
VEENLSILFMETQTFLKLINFSFQTYIKSTICIFLKDFYLVLLKEVCARSSQLHGHNVKCPFYLNLGGALCVGLKSDMS